MKLGRISAPARSSLNAGKYAVATALGGALLGAMALVARRQASNAEQRHPAVGKFLNVDGVRLHYVERGTGEPLLLIHGNGTQIEDFETSGLIDLAADTHRVIVFDRPGFGHSSRPRGTVWTPSAQAHLLHEALAQLGSRALRCSRTLMGCRGRCGACARSIRLRLKVCACIWVLLSNGSFRRRPPSLTGVARHRRPVALHAVPFTRASWMARSDVQDLLAGDRFAVIFGRDKRDGASPVAASLQRCRIDSYDSQMPLRCKRGTAS